MIKYFEFDSVDEYGQHILPINTERDINLTKIAASNWAPELRNVIDNLKKDPKYYYVVINALGSLEVWGPNRNGDGFPEEGLKHVSLRSDMGTPSDYGFKTFEYYAKLFKHHVNKDPKRSFGHVVYSYWNDNLKRVELVVAVNRETGADIVEAIENGDIVSVSMGCKLKYDRCSICDNKAKKVVEYCKHLKKFMGKIVTEEQAKEWSIQLKKTILPGTAIFAYNDYPRFFDISKVYIGADRTSYILGKAASVGHVIPSALAAESYGVTDEIIDKLAALGKSSELEKVIGTGDNDVDGKIIATPKPNAMKEKVEDLITRTISKEERIPNKIIDPISSNLPLRDVFSTLFGLGIHPKPVEVQRIVLINTGQTKLANYLDDNNMCFDPNDNSVAPVDMEISESRFNDPFAKTFISYLEKRSSFPIFLEKRASVISKNDYWQETGPNSGLFIETSPIPKELKIAGGLAAIYAGLKAKAAGMTPKTIMSTFQKKPWLRSLIGGGVMLTILNKLIAGRQDDPVVHRPASDYAGILQDTNFSGHMKLSSVENAVGLGILAGALTLPAAYAANAYNQKSMYYKGKKLFPGADTGPKKAAIGVGAGTVIGTAAYDALKKKILKVK